MHLRLVAPADVAKILLDPANKGYEPGVVRGLLEQSADRGHTHEIIDSDTLPTDQLHQLYDGVSALAMRLHVRVSPVFGSARKSGQADFGTKIPALLLYDEKGGKLIGVSPHQTKGGPLETIVGFLQSST